MRLQASLMLGVCLASASAAAQSEADSDAAATESAPASPTDRAVEEPPRAQPPPASVTPPAFVPVEEKPTAQPSGWHTDVTGYFRAPIIMGLSSRPGPDNPTGPSSTQVSYGPNRIIDWNYYSFAYTRLQEQDWVELFVHERKQHVDAVVGWMGYWFQSAGFRNPDAAWAPGMAYLTLDTDFKAGELNPNIAATVGAWWPKFGYFEKYDTYTLGRFRQIGEQLKLTVPLDPDLTVVGIQGFGTNRDGSFNYLAPPFYGSIVGLDLLAWFNLQIVYKDVIDVSAHYNTEWMADPNLEQQSTMGPKSYGQASQAHLTVGGLEANLRLPYVGHFWLSPSYLAVRNGWALASGGTEVMHSLGGAGIATNYMAYTGSPSDSTGSGTMINVGFLYENTLSGVQGKRPGSILPELTLNIFALYTRSSLTLPVGSTLPQSEIKQIKYGADLTLQTLSWLSLMLRGDLVNYDMDNGGYIFAVLTARAAISSHFLSSERIYLQYSRYKYGDKMLVNGTWRWGQPLVAGSNVLQEGPYSGKTPDQNVLKIQAEVAF
jgi:hypothetical protein